MRGFSVAEFQTPAFAPTVAIEVLSPDDDARDVAEKVDVYLWSGSALVFFADPAKRTMTLYDGAAPKTLFGGDVFQHESLPGFSLPLETFFSRALDLHA